MSGGGEGAANPADQAKTDALYEDREPKKIIRIITVTAYMVSVSFVGLTLSAYYIFLWHPPNPRLMHAQAISSHSERQISFLSDYEKPTNNDLTLKMASQFVGSNNNGVIDLLNQASTDSETLKIRREIVENVNAILRANFEKTRSSDTSHQNTTGSTRLLNDSVTLDNITESSAPVNESSSSPREQNENLNSPTTEQSAATTASRMKTTTRRPKSSGKKQHQTPFALKHLEVPIKQDSTRKRPARFTTTTTTRRSPVSSDTRGTSIDNTTPLTPIILDSSRVTDNANPPEQQAGKSLYKTLTTPARYGDYATDSPLMPSISSDQYQTVPDDYRDSTIIPNDDTMDD